jgi:hypothetical protein
MSRRPQNGEQGWGNILNSHLDVALDANTGQVKPQGIQPGSTGQVLVTDSNGTPTWGDAQGVTNNTSVNLDIYNGGGVNMTDPNAVSYWWPGKGQGRSGDTTGNGFMPAGISNPDNTDVPTASNYRAMTSGSRLPTGIYDFDVTGNGVLVTSFAVGHPAQSSHEVNLILQKKDKTEQIVLGNQYTTGTGGVGTSYSNLLSFYYNVNMYISSEYRLRFHYYGEGSAGWIQYRQL